MIKKKEKKRKSTWFPRNHLAGLSRKLNRPQQWEANQYISIKETFTVTIEGSAKK